MNAQAHSAPVFLPRAAHHAVEFERTGFSLGDTVTPVCCCGWRGRAESESNDWLWTNLREQESAHLRQVRGL